MGSNLGKRQQCLLWVNGTEWEPAARRGMHPWLGFSPLPLWPFSCSRAFPWQRVEPDVEVGRMRLAEARDQYNCLVKSLDEKQRLFYLFQEVKALAAESCLTLCDPMDYSPPGPLSMESSRQEYWSGWLSPSSGDLLDSGIEPGSAILQAVLYHLSQLLQTRILLSINLLSFPQDMGQQESLWSETFCCNLLRR